MNKKTLVISIDALISDDIPLLETLPNLGPFVKGAAQVRDIECIYPTLTYPCHVSIMTGCYPDKHNIVHNERLQVNVPKPYKVANMNRGLHFLPVRVLLLVDVHLYVFKSCNWSFIGFVFQ